VKCDSVEKRRSHGRTGRTGDDGLASLMPSFEGNLLTQWHQITSLETRDSRLSYGEDPESISPGLGSPPGRNRQTDGRTDRIAIANTRLSSTCRYSCGA